jgi:peptide/nickel transport system substrate-binding protein
VTKASSIAGTAGCPDWNAAETALFKNVDLVPFVNSALGIYAKGATFQFTQDMLNPASIRMLG